MSSALFALASLILAGGSTSVSAKQDVTVTGSVVKSGLDTAIIAGRDVNIVPGEEGRDSEYYHKVSGLGISFSSNGSGASLFAGYQAITDTSSFHGSYTAASLVAAGNDLTIQAGNNFNQIGSDLSADNDAWITAGGTFVSLAAAQREVMDRFHEELRIGITASVQVGALQTAQTIAKAIDRIGGGVSGGRGGGEGITNAIAIAQIAGVSASYGAGVANAYLGGAGSTNAGAGAAADKALGISASISFGASDTKTSSHSESETARVSTIRTGNDLDITAKSIALQGTQVAALGNLYLTATDGDVSITAAKNGFLSSSSSSSWGASVGLGWSFSPSTGGFASTGVTVSANASQSNSNSSGTSYTNATLSSGGLLSVLAKQDIGIEGANLRGETAKINAGRDFWIASVQGTSSSTSSSSGFNASLTFGPGGAPTSGSLGVNGSSGVGSKAWTDKPSSLTAAGTLDITVGQQTSVLGALINSDKGKLSLSTGTLVTADPTDKDVYQSTGGGITVGFGGGFPVKNISFDIQDRGKDGITRATIGLGTVTLRDVTPAQAADALAQINRDPAKLQEVLKSWDFAAGGSLDVDALVKLPENLQALAKAFEALTTPVPDDVAAMGPRAEEAFRKFIANGKSPDEIAAWLTSPAGQVAMQYRAAYEQLSGMPGNEERLRAIEFALKAGEALFVDPENGLGMKVECGTAGPCLLLQKWIGGNSKMTSTDLIKLINESTSEFLQATKADDGSVIGAGKWYETTITDKRAGTTRSDLIFACALELASTGGDTAALTYLRTSGLYTEADQQRIAKNFEFRPNALAAFDLLSAVDPKKSGGVPLDAKTQQTIDNIYERASKIVDGPDWLAYKLQDPKGYEELEAVYNALKKIRADDGTEADYGLVLYLGSGVQKRFDAAVSTTTEIGLLLFGLRGAIADIAAIREASTLPLGSGYRIATEGQAGEPAAVIMSEQQSALLQSIRASNSGSIDISAAKLNFSDLAALQASTGLEYAVIRTAAGERLLVQLGAIGGEIPAGSRLIAHTHPGTTDILSWYGSVPSAADIEAIRKMGQARSYIVNSYGDIMVFRRDGSYAVVPRR